MLLNRAVSRKMMIEQMMIEQSPANELYSGQWEPVLMEVPAATGERRAIRLLC
jgi:hypothetical protein